MYRRLISGILLICMMISIMAILPDHALAATPTTTVTISGPAYGSSPTYVNLLSRFALTASEPGGGTVSTWYRWNAHDAVEYSAPFGPSVIIQTPGAPVLPIDLEGLNTLYYNSTDSAGNHETPKTLEVFVDNYSPNSTIDFSDAMHVGQQIYLNSSSLITIASTDDGSGLKSIFYSVDQGPVNTYSAPFTIDEDGTHTIHYYGEDNLGTKEDDRIASIFVDMTGPEVRIIPGQPNATGYVTLDTAIKIVATDTGSGIQGVYYKVDSGPWQSYSQPFHLTGEGSHSISSYAVDKVSNQGQTSITKLIVDSIPPDVTAVGAVNGAIDVKWGENVTFTATDTGVGNITIFYSQDDGILWNEYKGITIMENAVITYYARDALGNAGNHQTLTVNVVMDSNDNMLYMKIGLGIAAVGTVLLIIINWPRKKSADGQDDEPEAAREPVKKKLKQRN